MDECYVDMIQAMEGFYSPVDAAMLKRTEFREKFGFTVNVGISSNKLLAKDGFLDLKSPTRYIPCFGRNPCENVALPIENCMAGHSSVEILKKLEI